MPSVLTHPQSRERIIYLDMAVDSSLEPLKPPASPEGLMDWFLYRVQHEPWALGGVVVMAVFILGILSLVIFALVYGCCCNSPNLKANRPRTKKKSDNDVI